MNTSRAIALVFFVSLSIWVLFGYIVYHKGFMDGVDSEKSGLANADVKLQNCNRIIVGNAK